MAVDVDVVLLGVGTSGEDLGLRLLDAGLQVVGIEPQLIGGECAYWACIPSKMMIRAANLVAEARRLDGLAGKAEVRPDWSAVAARIRTEATADWDDSIAVERFRSRGGQVVKDRGRFTGPGTVTAGGETFTARRGVVVATGSKPLIPPIRGLAEAPYWTTHEAIQADPLPESMLVLGGGAVGCELGQAFARFGTEVTILEGRDRLLANEEPEASHLVTESMGGEGVDVITGDQVEEVSHGRRGIAATLGNGSRRTAERLLVATGRTVDLSGLGLETVGLDGSARSIEVDDRCRAADGVWAMGDVTRKAMFTHVAEFQSAVVAADILGEEPPVIDYDAVPRVTFTDPEVGSVGLTEAEAAERGIDVATVVKGVPATFRGWVHGAGNDGLIKLVVDRGRDLLVGATAVGPHGGEVLGLLSVAVQGRIPLRRLRSMIYAFPTFHGGIGEAIGAYGRGLTTVIDPGFDPLLD